MDAELYYITKSGDLHRLRRLYDANPEFLLQVTPQLNTALHLATRFGHLDVISEIYGRHPSLLVQANAKGDTPLHVAARAGNGRAVELLLNCAKGTANLGGEDGRSEGCGLLGMRNKENSTALLEAVRRGHRNTAVRLIEAGPELLSAVDDAGESPLYVAAENGMLEVVGHILSASSSSAAHGGPNGRTPLHAAAIKGHLDDNGDVTNSSNGEPPSLDSYKTRASTLSLVATLIATVTFAAAFTMPGGYFSDGPDRGKAVLARRTAFKVFLISDTIAMSSSIMVTFLLIWAATGDRDLLVHTLRFCMKLMWIALESMAVAFVTGVYLVASKSRWLTIVVCVLGCCISSLVRLALLSHFPLRLKWRRRNGVALFKLFILDFTSTLAFADLDGKNSFWSALTRLLFLRGHS